MAQSATGNPYLLATSLGKKYLMALSGLFLISFLPVHLAGNLLLLKQDGGAAFDVYSQFMSTSPLIRVLEVTLVAGFLVHIIDGILLTLKNRAARPVGYKGGSGGKPLSVFSKYMSLTGTIILIYLIIHINSFTLKHRVYEPGNVAFYHTVKSAFETGWGGLYPWFYVLAMFLMALHLNHGFQSAFQSLGLNHKKYTPLIKKVGLLYSIVIPLGFAAIPVYFQLRYLNIL
ncbi:MAG TPA: succinate dehydrogenase cytochrome b subunit [Turneriella sp.]|nr:succinate dehydrogenase cytochrome b subunit [Turneriella sp.]HNE19666.1 succinate dehydrogenase cytochrome b subunit [Turneriella sp.]HNJ65156.1 succinate dehydrogenase cytochrome b subunit [Turneriella sp.]HNL09187.1 succinate dehydrogenase cytochrome b subunit [Turneriella sp.]HNN01316.1 succinate dehydrogenase cytochrome b subunit [Turneriella sp.]